MNPERAAEELSVIRELMERPVKYSTQSGLAGILAGLSALGGVALDNYFSNRYEHAPETAFWINLVVWAGVFLIALAAVVACTRLREKKQGMPFWSRVKRIILRSILPSFVAGAGITAAIVYRWFTSHGPNQWGLIPPVWMLFYGVACWQVGEFSVREMRVMGAAFILSGIITGAFLQTHPYWSMGLTFGGFHLIYGIVVWIRHGG